MIPEGEGAQRIHGCGTRPIAPAIARPCFARRSLVEYELPDASHLAEDRASGLIGERIEPAAGARSRNPALRTFVDIPADPAARHVDAIRNGHFRLVDARSALPSGWTLERSDPAIRFVPAASLVGDARAVLEIGSAPTTTTPRTARLSTTLALPEARLALSVNVPDTANRPPYSELYGLRLETLGAHGFVLFGEPAEGTLASGERFVTIAAKRGTWTLVTLSLREALIALGLPPARQRFIYDRNRDLDLPSTPVTPSLYLALAAGATGQAGFGALAIEERESQGEALVRRGLEDPAGREAWRAAWNREQRAR